MLLDFLAKLTPEQQQQSIQSVVEHNNIYRLYEQLGPKHMTIELPHSQQKGEWVEVTWTLEIPRDDQIRDKVARRRHRLDRLLQEAEDCSACPSPRILAEVLHVSERTIARDLEALQKTRKWQRPANPRNSKR